MEVTVLRVHCIQFCAGVIIKRGKIVRAAPILGRWIGHKLEELLIAAKDKHWHIEIVR